MCTNHLKLNEKANNNSKEIKEEDLDIITHLKQQQKYYRFFKQMFLNNIM